MLNRSGTASHDIDAELGTILSPMSLTDPQRETARSIRASLLADTVPPHAFRAALTSVPSHLRDAWLDVVLDTGEIPPDDDDLPRGCAPYLPCSVDAVLAMIDHARVESQDVFVDIGSGLGRAAILTHLLTGAAAIGIEIQARLVSAARERRAGLNLQRFGVVHGDATRLSAYVPIGSVFFLYCPFSGERLEKVLDDLEPIARTKTIRICCVGVPVPERPWLEPVVKHEGELAVYRSTLLDGG